MVAVFTDAEDTYSPLKHLQAMLTIEQFFRRVHSALAAHNDPQARRALLFTVMDTLPALVGRDLVAAVRSPVSRVA
jgi:hypothetical protein